MMNLLIGKLYFNCIFLYIENFVISRENKDKIEAILYILFKVHNFRNTHNLKYK